MCVTRTTIVQIITFVSGVDEGSVSPPIPKRRACAVTVSRLAMRSGLGAQIAILTILRRAAARTAVAPPQPVGMALCNKRMAKNAMTITEPLELRPRRASVLCVG